MLPSKGDELTRAMKDLRPDRADSVEEQMYLMAEATQRAERAWFHKRLAIVSVVILAFVFLATNSASAMLVDNAIVILMVGGLLAAVVCGWWNILRGRW